MQDAKGKLSRVSREANRVLHGDAPTDHIKSCTNCDTLTAEEVG